ncbi:MAG TPA: hypothetical protein VFK40_08105 [Nitrososphaeraceae archaeon]|nr:hypothetical protein [Nitrososphaeraceae archaeon]
MTYHDSLNKDNLIWLGVAVGLWLFFSLPLLMLHEIFADDDDGYVICPNKVWYPKGTDCKATLEKYGYVVKYPEDEQDKSQLPEHYTATGQGVKEDIADLEDDLADATTDKEKNRLTNLLDEAKDTEQKIQDVKEGKGSVPNELEGKLTQEETQELAESNYDWEYEWEDGDYNPVPGTPSYKAPNQREDIKEFNDDGSHDLDGDPSTGIEVDDPVSASHERNEEEPVEINNDTPQVTPNVDDEANMDRSYEYEGSDEDSIKEAQEADDKYLDVGEGEPEPEPVENIIASPKVELEDVDNPTDYQKKILDKIEEEKFEEDEYQAEEEDDEADEESEDDSGDSEESGSEDSSSSDDGEDSGDSSESEE